MRISLNNPKNALLVQKNQFETTAWDRKATICGIDEVGRGCLAGPVVTAAAILPVNINHDLLRDSKTLSEKQREIAYLLLIKNCWYGVGLINNRLIDKHNIYQATLLAMKKALVQVLIHAPEQPEIIVIDAMPLKTGDTGFGAIPVHFFTKGESKSTSIAAASIIAKVTRDRMMQHFNKAFPGYYLDGHKGYATKKHREVLQIQPPSLIHRNTFLSNIMKQKKDYNERQQCLC